MSKKTTIPGSITSESIEIKAIDKYKAIDLNRLIVIETQLCHSH